MSFVARITTLQPDRPAELGSNFSRAIRRIIVHHSVTTGLPRGGANPRPYHFCIDQNGRVFNERCTRRVGAHTGGNSVAGVQNNQDSLGIGLIGNFHNQVEEGINPMVPSNALLRNLESIIADCLVSFRTIDRSNQFTLPLTAHAQQSIGWLERDRRAPRTSNSGIKGHDDAFGTASRCPGWNTNMLSGSFVARAIHMANTFDGADRLRTRFILSSALLQDAPAEHWARNAFNVHHGNVNLGTVVINMGNWPTFIAPSNRFVTAVDAINHLSQTRINIIPASVAPTWRSHFTQAPVSQRVPHLERLLVEVANRIN